MRLAITSVMVDDQEKALQFYTTKLGFVKKIDVPMGPDARWLTVISPEGPEGIELLLEPMVGNPAAPIFQKALFDAGIPATAFLSEDLPTEYEKLKSLGVVFRSEPIPSPFGIDVIFEDTCGNLINLHQQPAEA